MAVLLSCDHPDVRTCGLFSPGNFARFLVAPVPRAKVKARVGRKSLRGSIRTASYRI